MTTHWLHFRKEARGGATESVLLGSRGGRKLSSGHLKATDDTPRHDHVPTPVRVGMYGLRQPCVAQAIGSGRVYDDMVGRSCRTICCDHYAASLLLDGP